jgi:hypothetical protein
MNEGLKTMRKALAAFLIIAGIVASWFAQERLNTRREALGLTRTAVISNAPPVLAFTTVALGGFRGLIANLLWIRTSDLQDDGKYFEAVQLADWITKLQPHFTGVWVYQAWNMAYNISVKFPEVNDRWLWVQRAVELLRDEGLRYNPDQALMYRELSWIFHHKMGQQLDDAHWVYKREWSKLMEEVLPGGRLDRSSLLDPKTPEDRARAKKLRETYKLDPVLMKRADDTYGPFDWRLPEAHAIYWAMIGIDHSPEQDKVPLRREIFQPMLAAFMHGRIITNKFMPGQVDLGPNLEMVANASKAYEDAIAAEPEYAEHFGRAHRNFLREAIYFLFAENREAEARKWFEFIRKHYGFTAETGITEGTSLMDYVLGEINENANQTSRDRVTAIITGLIGRAFTSLADGNDEESASYDRLAKQLYENYKKRTDFGGSKTRVALTSYAQVKENVLRALLAPAEEVNPEYQKILRTKLNLPADWGATPSTNAPPQGAGPTNNPPASAVAPR